MAPTSHSSFPASSSHRLLACPGSYTLGMALGPKERRSTIYSAEGTLAHSISEASLFAGLDPATQIGKTFKSDGHEFTPDDEFVDAVQVYIDFIEGLRAMGFYVALETRVSPMLHWTGLPVLGLDLFGTADCIAYHPQTQELVIGDLKFGKGVAVEAQNNDQFLYYGAGAMDVRLINRLRLDNDPASTPLPADWKPSKVTTVCIQPRAWYPQGPIRLARYTADEVRAWARERLYKGVDVAINDNGQTLQAGEHCRWCPALAHCSAHRQHMQDTARAAFAAVPAVNTPDPLAAMPAVSISDAALGDLLDKIALLKPFIAAVEQLGKDRSEAKPNSIPNWKVVPTLARRAWGSDPGNVIADLHNAGVPPGKYTETRLLSPAQVEKRIGKQSYDALVKQHVGRNSSGTKLVPEADPRARLQGRTAQEAFGAIPANTPAN